MNYFTLNGIKNGKPIEKKCARLIMGTGGDFFTKENFKRVKELLDGYLNSGGNIIDTAHQYQGSEEALGKWLETDNNREKVYVLTKGAHHDDGEAGKRVNPDAITKDLMESLERLKTDYVDFYALHRDDTNVEVGPIMEVLNEHIKNGRIHSIGVSNWSWQRIDQANRYAIENDLIGFSFNSPSFSLARSNEPRWEGCVSADESTLKWHKATQTPLLAWSSQASGFFSGNFSPEDHTDKEMVRVYYNEKNWERYKRAKKIAVDNNMSTIQIALSYVLNQPFPTFALIGPETIEELDSSIIGAEFNLNTEDVNWLSVQN